MTEISTVQVVPQMKVVKIANCENTGKAYLLNEPINDTVVIGKGEKKGGGIGRGLLSFIFPGLGELTDGRVGAGLGFMGTALGLGAFSRVLFNKYVKKMPMPMENIEKAIENGANPVKVGVKGGIKLFINTLKKMPKSHKIALLGTMVAAWGVKLLSGLNAASGKRD